jgi:hypothetical protein
MKSRVFLLISILVLTSILNLKGLMITTTHSNNNKKKYKIIGLTSESAENKKFELNDIHISVAEYFKKHKNLPLRYKAILINKFYP